LFQPEEFLLAVPWGAWNIHQSVDMPRFNCTTSISLSIGDGKYPTDLRLPPTAAGECLFPTLTTLVLSGYCAEDGLATLVSHCPRLVVLRYAVRGHWASRQDYAITVHSATLRELVVEESAMANRVDIATPMLNQLTVSCYCLIRGDLTTVSIVAPVAEKVWWRCRQSNGASSGFGCWYLQTVSLMTPPPSPAPAVEAPRRPWLLRIDAHCRVSSTIHAQLRLFLLITKLING
jgi:hypothetical protein